MAETLSAEVTLTKPDAMPIAAKLLQERGFRILYFGKTITVEADVTLWSDVFGAQFYPHTTQVQEQPHNQVQYLRVDPTSVRIPQPWAHLINDVAFAEPPQWHGMP